MIKILVTLLIPTLFAVNIKHVGFIKFTDPVPDFIFNMSLKAQYDYKMILENRTISVGNQTSSFRTWAGKYNVTAELSKYESQQNTTRSEFNQNVTSILSQLSSVNSQIVKIADNSTLSEKEQRAAVEDLADGPYEQEVAAVLFVRRLVDQDDFLTNKRSG